jgi:ABC-2 type transport system permease protein
VILALLVITVAVAMILSALYPRFRDVAQIWAVLSTALFYATPVIYPISIAPDRFQDILHVNPLTPIFEQAQKWIIDPSAPGALGGGGESGWLLALSAVIFVAVCAIAAWVFNREAPRIAEEL